MTRRGSGGAGRMNYLAAAPLPFRLPCIRATNRTAILRSPPL
ncbi:hypothetical protein KNP414_01676 [Paenibacillus mucilaginosus KNP414]|uniref:Uncharacterized protein n=1 Tax=Paenibacillus mucilaginosus (strain KNP414) TaxID=1036673 RepID=F8FPL5_PAEMK|nr:hypothetical protein KNP414_01676 [Paenibacillus mucilaginosus KNP414]